jgi:hypothetical protein
VAIALQWPNVSAITRPFSSQAAQGAVRLEGDVITANGSILSGQLGTQGDTISLDDDASVCSCRCSGFYKKRRRPRFTVRRSPGKISHLLLMQPLPASSSIDNDKPEDGEYELEGHPDLGELSQHEYAMRPSSLAPLLQLPPHRASI